MPQRVDGEPVVRAAVVEPGGGEFARHESFADEQDNAERLTRLHEGAEVPHPQSGEQPQQGESEQVVALAHAERMKDEGRRMKAEKAV